MAWMVRSGDDRLDHEDWARSTLPDKLYGNILSLDESPVNIVMAGDVLSGGQVDNDEVLKYTRDEQSKVDVFPTTNTKVVGLSTVIRDLLLG